MKPFNTYQYLEGEILTERDKKELGSKYWNEGKWNNFIKPLLPKEFVEEMTFVEVGTNAGLFLKLAKEFGFKKVIGIEPEVETFKRGIQYRDKHHFDYELINKKIQDCDDLPMTDVTLLANAHYYLDIDYWKQYLNILEFGTRICIIVTADKRPNEKFAPSDIKGIRASFKNWEEIGFIDIPKDGTNYSRKLWSFAFKNPLLDRVDIDSVDNGNGQQRDFLKQADEGINIFKTDYYRRLKDYRQRTGSHQQVWSNEFLNEYMKERIKLYDDIKKNGMYKSIDVRMSDRRIIDGNHRHDIMKHLGDKTILITKV